jgi:hypothetical protein
MENEKSCDFDHEIMNLVEQNKCRHCNPGQNPNYCKQSPGNVFCK